MSTPGKTTVAVAAHWVAIRAHARTHTGHVADATHTAPGAGAFDRVEAR